MKATVLFFTSLTLAGTAISATDNPYAGQETRAIKALTDQEIADYSAGRGMGTSKAAELNHYPGPRHVLDAGDSLKLTAEQKEKIERLFASMDREAKQIGRRIVAKEAELEALYAKRQATAANTRRVIDELARLQADFRFAHLNAHLATPGVLTEEQLARYDALRGYGTGQPTGPTQQHRH